MGCYLLIHGNRHGKWAWDSVVQLLQDRGHEVHAIDLPGHGQDQAPRETITLHDYATAVVNYVRNHRLDHLILVGHSAGGCVLGDVAHELGGSLVGMVFVAALVLNVGESQMSDVPPDQQAAILALAQSRADYSIPIHQLCGGSTSLLQ